MRRASDAGAQRPEGRRRAGGGGAAREAVAEFCRRYLPERIDDLFTLVSLTLPPALLLHAGADAVLAAAATVVAARAITPRRPRQALTPRSDAARESDTMSGQKQRSTWED